MKLRYSDFYKNYSNYKGKKYRFIGILNKTGEIVKSCWRNVTENEELLENPKNITITVKEVEVAL